MVDEDITDEQRMAYVRQHVQKALGITKMYTYQTDMGVEANKINDQMMREIITQTKKNPESTSARENCEDDVPQ